MTTTCFECGREFITDTPGRNICRACDLEWARKEVPELLGPISQFLGCTTPEQDAQLIESIDKVEADLESGTGRTI